MRFFGIYAKERRASSSDKVLAKVCRLAESPEQPSGSPSSIALMTMPSVNSSWHRSSASDLRWSAESSASLNSENCVVVIATFVDSVRNYYTKDNYI